jgi:hypothetical protein
MPLYDLGYRAWRGARLPRWSLWYVVTSTGFSLAWKSRWLRRLLFLAWLPAAYLGLGIFLFEKAVEYPDWRSNAEGFLRAMPDTKTISFFLGTGATAFTERLADSRYQVWALVILTLFRYPQGLIMVLLVGLIAPPLISTDLRSRAYLLYFSRPLSIVEYLIGKSAVVWSYLFLIVALPAMSLFLVGLLLSSDFGVLQYTWDLPLRIVAAFALLAIPTTALALAISSVFQENRNAVAAWFAVWILGAVVFTNLASISAFRDQNIQDSWWSSISLYHLLGSVQGWIFGFAESHRMIWAKITILIVITVLSLTVLYRKVSAPIRA